jgi:hypothetical protein
MMDPRLTHAALQTRIAKVRAAAHDRDQSRMQGELDQLVRAVGEHLAVESPALDGLPEIAVAAAKNGQARILSTVAALVRSATATNCDDCESLAGELDALVERQDIVERKAFRSRDCRDMRRGRDVRRAVGADTR